MPDITLEALAKRQKETADLVEQAVDKLGKTASKQEVLDLIKERKKGDDELLTKVRADITELNNGFTETRQTVNQLNSRIRDLKSRSAGDLFAGGRYNGLFSSPHEAKAFALIVMASVLAGRPEHKSRFDKIRKSLESLDIEPYWLDADGRKAMTGGDAQAGGSLVTTEQIPSIMMLIELYGKYRKWALNLPMGAGRTLWPKTSGLMTMTCPGEGAAGTQATPTIPLIGLTPKTLVGLTAYSLELEEDSLVALGEFLGGLFARSCAYYEDLCGFLGDGTSTYLGFRGITGALLAVSSTIANIKSLVVGAGNAYSELTLANFVSVAGILPEFADDGDARWFVHRYFFFTVMVSLALAANVGTANEILTGAATKQRTYLSYPVEFAQVMPRVAANSQICALLANLRQGAILGTRGGIQVSQSEHVYFAEGLIGVRVGDRIDINAHGVGDTTSAGPVCGLITAAS